MGPRLHKHSGAYGFEDANGYPFADRREHDRMSEPARERCWDEFLAFQAKSAERFAPRS